MKKNIVRVEGMACNMCEIHVADAIRNAIPEAKKVKASYTKKEAVFFTEDEVDFDAVQVAIDATGYTFVDAKSEPAKKGLFGGYK